MMKLVGVVGYKDSGKTTLTCALARELVDRGHTVAVIKHTSHRVDLAEKDTAALLEAAGQAAILSEEMAGVFWRESIGLERALVHLDADLVLVEGFKDNKTYPKIACLRGEPDDGELFDGLIVAAVGPTDQVDLEVPSFARDDVAPLADLVEQKAFKLPDLDCAACGYETCCDMAREIVAGRSSVEDCVSLRPAVKVMVGGQALPMNPFIANIVRGTITGLLSSLKGFGRGKIEIEL